MKTIVDLRGALFETIKALQDPKNPLDIYRAKAICDAAQIIVNTAKVEVEFLRATDDKRGTSFIPQEKIDGPKTEPSGYSGTLNPGRR